MRLANNKFTLRYSITDEVYSIRDFLSIHSTQYTLKYSIMCNNTVANVIEKGIECVSRCHRY